MKKFGYLVLTLLLLGGLVFGFQNRDTVSQQIDAVIYQSPCKVIPYRVGEIDPRFDLTEEIVLSDAQQAAALWNYAYGKELFVYDSQAELSINFVYDERQALSTQIDAVDSQLEQRQEQMKPEIAAYEQRVADYERRFSALNQEIESWNSKGGAPSDVYDQLVASQKALQQEGEQLNAQARSLNQTTNQYNLQVKDLTQKVDSFNDALKVKPEEGLYVLDEKGQRIYIYFNTSRAQLIHTLAHEMGHAIGLDHVTNPSALMYPKTSDSLFLAQQDLDALATQCRKRSLAERVQERISIVQEILKQQ